MRNNKYHSGLIVILLFLSGLKGVSMFKLGFADIIISVLLTIVIVLLILQTKEKYKRVIFALGGLISLIATIYMNYFHNLKT